MASANGETHNIPIELFESRYGLKVEQYAFRNDDGGAGEFRGGKGLVLDYRVASDEAFLTYATSRSERPPWAMRGGRPGSLNSVKVLRQDGAVEKYDMCTRVRVARGDPRSHAGLTDCNAQAVNPTCGVAFFSSRAGQIQSSRGRFMNISGQLHRRAADFSTLITWSDRVRKALPVSTLVMAMLSCLSACGGGNGNGYLGNAGPPLELFSFAGTTGVFVAWADPSSGNYASAPIGSFAGKKQVLHGSIDFLTGANLGQPAGMEIYKGSDGYIHAVDLTTFGSPAPQQISTESAATVDDICSFTGTAAPGANYDYAGIYFAADLQVTTNSSYFYRLPGPDGVCDTPDDIVHMVKTGMSPTDAPIVVSGMPVTTVHTSLGGISGFVIKSGANLALVDSNFANPVVLGTFATPINVAVALPVSTTQGYPTGQLFVVDGNIVSVNYEAHTTSAALFSIPNWTPTDAAALFAAAPSTLYFSISLPATTTAAESATIYAMPANGSAAPVVVDTEVGHVAGLQFPVQSSNLIYGIEDPAFALYALPSAGGPVVTLMSGVENSGNFTATATSVYYTTWAGSFDSTTNVSTRSGTQSGIVGVNGTVVQAPLANSMFISGGEEFPWPDDTTTTQTPYETVFQVTGLSPVTVANATTGEEYIDDGVSGGTLTAIDTTSNQTAATIGTLPSGTATFLSGTFRGYGHTGFIEATTAISTQDPATRDLYLLNSQQPNSLTQVTNNL